MLQEWEFVEFFSGEAQLSEALKHHMRMQGVSLDVAYGFPAGDMTTSSGFALAIATCLRIKPGGLAIMAPVCSSMGNIAAHSTGRSSMQPEGTPDCSRSAHDGNTLSKRPGFETLQPQA